MINIPPASFRLTPYGEVDAVALENRATASTPLNCSGWLIAWTSAWWNWVESPPFATSY